MIAKTPEEKAKLKLAKASYKQEVRKQKEYQAEAEVRQEERKRKQAENPMILTGLLDTEYPLADDFPVNWNYYYVACKDGKYNVIRSSIQGNVRQLKRDLEQVYKTKISEIFRCDLMGRNML